MLKVFLAAALLLAVTACEDPEETPRQSSGRKVVSDAIGDGLATWAWQRNQRSGPVFTNCTRTGNMVNCTSY